MRPEVEPIWRSQEKVLSVWRNMVSHQVSAEQRGPLRRTLPFCLHFRNQNRPVLAIVDRDVWRFHVTILRVSAAKTPRPKQDPQPLHRLPAKLRPGHRGEYGLGELPRHLDRRAGVVAVD